MASRLKKFFKGKSGSSNAPAKVSSASNAPASAPSASNAPANAPANAPSAPNAQDTAVSENRSDLYQLWKGITGEAKVPLGSAKYWDLERDPWIRRPVAFTTAEFFGCTVVLIADAKHALIGHFHEEIGSNAKVMEDKRRVQQYIINVLSENLLFWDLNETCRAWIIHSSGRSVGYNLLKEFLEGSGMRGDRIHNRPYTAAAGTGEFPDSPKGKAVLQWKGSGNGETLSVYIQNENPDVYSINSNGELLEA